MKKVGIVDVAKAAGVSKSTISQYLNGRYSYMGENTKKRIEKTIYELEYEANYVARSLKLKRTSTIGIIVANILHNFSTQVIRSVEDVCNKQDIHVIVCNADDNPEKEKRYINILRAKQVDGLIIFPIDGNLDLYRQMIKEQYPLIFIDRKIKNLKVETFLLDNEDATKKAVDHFIERGHKRIGLITTSLIHSVTPRTERILGYKKALESHKILPIKKYVKNYNIQDIKNGLEEMFDLKEPPNALIAGNDLVLMEILNFIKENNIKIPDELALIGIDEVSFANIYSPPLTTINQPAFEMGEKAAQQLLNIINKEKEIIGTVHRFKGELIIRESS